MTLAKFCPSKSCQNFDWLPATRAFCKDCGTALAPIPSCLCGELVNLKFVEHMYQRYEKTTFCSGCGKCLVDAHLVFSMGSNRVGNN